MHIQGCLFHSRSCGENGKFFSIYFASDFSKTKRKPFGDSITMFGLFVPSSNSTLFYPSGKNLGWGDLVEESRLVSCELSEFFTCFSRVRLGLSVEQLIGSIRQVETCTRQHKTQARDFQQCTWEDCQSWRWQWHDMTLYFATGFTESIIVVFLRQRSYLRQVLMISSLCTIFTKVCSYTFY